jgi:hypothetical protein
MPDSPGSPHSFQPSPASQQLNNYSNWSASNERHKAQGQMLRRPSTSDVAEALGKVLKLGVMPH